MDYSQLTFEGLYLTHVILGPGPCLPDLVLGTSFLASISLTTLTFGWGWHLPNDEKIQVLRMEFSIMGNIRERQGRRGSTVSLFRSPNFLFVKHPNKSTYNI